MRTLVFLFFAVTPLFAQDVVITRPDGTKIMVSESGVRGPRPSVHATPVRETVFVPVQVTEYLPMPVTATRYYAVPVQAAPCSASPGLEQRRSTPATPIRSAIRGFFGKN